jgi:dCMP deaminase
MEIAKISALRSKDPHTQVGCCIVNDHKIIGVGYNGMPTGIPDNHPAISWERPDKYSYVVHAEVNAVLNTISFDKLKGATMYCTLFPCNECTKVLIQSGIREIVYLDTKHPERNDVKTSQTMLQIVGIPYRKFTSAPCDSSSLTSAFPSCFG